MHKNSRTHALNEIEEDKGKIDNRETVKKKALKKIWEAKRGDSPDKRGSDLKTNMGGKFISTKIYPLKLNQP